LVSDIEEHRLRVFENRVLRRIFGPKRDEVTREWRKLHNKELWGEVSMCYTLPTLITVHFDLVQHFIEDTVLQLVI
jgi:hypothetical protein